MTRRVHFDRAMQEHLQATQTDLTGRMWPVGRHYLLTLSYTVKTVFGTRPLHTVLSYILFYIYTILYITW